MPTKKRLIRVYLADDHHERYDALCAREGVRMPAALRAYVIDRVDGPPPTYEPMQGATRGPRTDQLRISTDASELSAVRARAERRGQCMYVWAEQVVRSALTGGPEFGASELEALRASTAELARVERTVSELVRRLDQAQLGGSDTADMARALTAIVDKHLRRVDRLILASAERWPLVERRP